MGWVPNGYSTHHRSLNLEVHQKEVMKMIRNKYRVLEKDFDAILKMSEVGISAKQIGALTHWSRATVSRVKSCGTYNEYLDLCKKLVEKRRVERNAPTKVNEEKAKPNPLNPSLEVAGKLDDIAEVLIQIRDLLMLK